MIKWNKPTVMSVQNAMAIRFCARSTSKKQTLKILQVTVEHDPFDAM